MSYKIQCLSMYVIVSICKQMIAFVSKHMYWSYRKKGKNWCLQFQIT